VVSIHPFKDLADIPCRHAVPASSNPKFLPDVFGVENTAIVTILAVSGADTRAIISLVTQIVLKLRFMQGIHRLLDMKMKTSVISCLRTSELMRSIVKIIHMESPLREWLVKLTISK
jgi:hypothetical protein